METFQNKRTTFEEFIHNQRSREVSDQDFKDSGAEILLDDKGNEKLRLQEEQIDFVRAEMHYDLNEDRKFNHVMQATLKTYLNHTTQMMHQLDENLGVNSTDIHLWDTMREELAEECNKQTKQTIEEIKSIYKKNSVLFTLADAVEKDIYLGSMQTLVLTLPEIISDKGDILTEGELEEMYIALRFLSLNAQHNFYKWLDDKQLHLVINMQLDLMRINPDFNYTKAGFYEIYDGIQNAYASLSLDLNSKPQYILKHHDEYYSKTQNCHNILKNLSRVETEYILQTFDVEVHENVH